MNDPIGLDALRLALGVLDYEIRTIPSDSQSYGPQREIDVADLQGARDKFATALAELTARRARDAEVGALVAKWREAASGIEEGCDDDDFLSDIEHDEAVAAAMFSCADDLESALLPFQRSDDKGDAT